MRRKTLTKMLSVILALSMTCTINPVIASERLAVKEKQEINKSKNYAEGQAVIMYDSTSTSTKSRMNTSWGNDMEIVDTYIFEQSEAKTKTRSISKTNDLSVSLVKSDKYSTEELITILKKNKNIKYAEPNYKIKKLDYNDTYYKYQWALNNEGQNAGIEGLDINGDTEFLGDKDSKERVIALIDTGIDYTHEDLKDVVWNNPYNNKKLYGEHGYDFINSDADPMDDNGHGSHCSGIMAGKSDNGAGIAGIAKSSNVKIMGLKILDEEGSGYGMESVGAYNYIYKAQQLGVNVVAVNNSWGGASEEESEILKTLINMVGEKGAISVCAAGNDGMDNDKFESIPANIDSDYVVSVAASNEKDELASFSNYGRKSVDIAAPGTDILSSVSYNCFNPSIYDNVSELCAYYCDFDNVNLVKTMNKDGYTGNQAGAGEAAYGTDSDGDGNVTVTTTNTQYFGKRRSTNRSLEWSVKDAEKGSCHYFYLPYEIKQSATETYAAMALRLSGPSGQIIDFEEMQDIKDLLGISSFYIADYKVDGNGKFNIDNLEMDAIVDTYVEQENYWSNLSILVSEKTRKDEKHVLVFAIATESEGDFTVYIDNFGISKENISSDKFGKYDFYNGTSMAAPYVTGAIAAISNAYPKESALQIKARVLGSVRRSGNLKDNVFSGGTLDLSKVDTPSMLVERVNYNSKNQIEIKGYYMNNAEVYVNDRKVHVISNDGKSLIIDGKDYVNKQISIKLTSGEVIYEDDYFFAKGKVFNKGSNIEGTIQGGQLLSSGDCLVYVNLNGEVSYGLAYKDEETNKESVMWTEGILGFEAKMFGKEYEQSVDYTISNDTDYIYANRKIYGVVSIDVGFSSEKILAVYEEEKGWKKLADIPNDMYQLNGSTLAAYNGELYLIGGVDEKGTLSNRVMKYSPATKKWTKGANIPENRAFSRAMQVGKKLIVTLGSNGTKEIPKNLIFDGQKWSVSKVKLQKSIDTYTEFFGEKKISITTAEIGLVKDGIIYTNLRVDGLGDTFTYNLTKDNFTPSAYSLNASELKYDRLFATTVYDKLFVLYGDEYNEDEEDEWFWKNKLSDIENLFEDEFEGAISSLYIPVTNGYINVEDKSEMGGYVEGAGTYLPGDTIILKAMVEDEELKIKKFVVNGKNIAKGKNGFVYIANASTCPNKMAAQVVASYDDFSLPKIGKAKISKAARTKNKKKIKIVLKKIKGATGYQIKCSTSKKFGKKVTKTINSKKVKVTLKKLKAKKKYYIKARAYSKFYGKKIYGKWSKVRVVKVKKKKVKKSKKK
ncbi:MAG: S8 family serine peptidase [Eubacterium sp.]|nr:S8 family serine peptidase [Eubacterium sp.]